MLKSIKDRRWFTQLIRKKVPFQFVRFSDGETEILESRYLSINDGKVHFRGKVHDIDYPEHDKKIFDPVTHDEFRIQLLRSLKHHKENYFRGIPAKHNVDAPDQSFYLSLIDENLSYLTFTDLFANSNYRWFKKHFFKTVVEQKKLGRILVLICNHRFYSESFDHIFAMPDNFFNDWVNVKRELVKFIESLPPDSIILSSASSMSNIIGYEISKRPDLRLTFLDVGTAINEYIGAGGAVRTYQLRLLSGTFENRLRFLKYILKGRYFLRW
jgi:hypothetical protein